MNEMVKIVVTVPANDAEKLMNAIGQTEAGKQGNYDFCSFSTKGVGRFRSLEGSHPTIGEVGKLEEVDEERIEVICPKEKLSEVVTAIKTAHPYEEPAIDVYPLLDF